MIRLVRRERGRATRALAPLAGHGGGSGRVVGALVYRGVTTVEVDTPVRALAERLDAAVTFIGPEVGLVPGVEPARGVIIDTSFRDASSVDVLVVPGGLGWRQVAAEPHVVDWLRSTTAHASVTLAISTGSLLLAAAGVLAGQEATGHWLAGDDLAELGAHVVSTRTAADETGRIATASGALAALQIADELADRVAWAR